MDRTLVQILQNTYEQSAEIQRQAALIEKLQKEKAALEALLAQSVSKEG